MKKKKILLMSLIPLSLIMLGACKEKNDNNKEQTSEIEELEDSLFDIECYGGYGFGGSFGVGPYYGEYDEDGELTIPDKAKFYGGDSEDVEISKIFSGAFKDELKLKKINIPGSINDIFGKAFENCTNLKSINFIEEGRKDLIIKYDAFQNTGVEDISISAKELYIDRNAFAGNLNLKSVNLKADRIVLFDSAFAGNPNLKNVSIDSKNIEIKGSCFANVFSASPNIEKFSISDSSFSFEDGLLIHEGELIYANGNLENVNLPDNVLTIGSYVFLDSKIKKIDLNNVKYIYDVAFAGSMLEEVIGGESIEYVEYNAFYNTKFTVNKEKLVLGSVLAVDSIDTDTYVVDDNIKSISYVQGKAKNIVIKSNVENIGAYAFSKVSGLEKVYFQSVYGTTSIDSKSFNKDVKLIIPNNTDRYYKENNKSAADRFTTENINITFYKNVEIISTVSMPYGSFLYEYIPNGYKSVKDKDGNIYNNANMLFFIEDTDLYLYESDVTWE